MRFSIAQGKAMSGKQSPQSRFVQEMIKLQKAEKTYADSGSHHSLLLCCAVASVDRQLKELSGLRPDLGQLWTFQQHEAFPFAVM